MKNILINSHVSLITKYPNVALINLASLSLSFPSSPSLFVPRKRAAAAAEVQEGSGTTGKTDQNIIVLI